MRDGARGISAGVNRELDAEGWIETCIVVQWSERPRAIVMVRGEEVRILKSIMPHLIYVFWRGLRLTVKR
jgi:hypothetical protein